MPQKARYHGFNNFIDKSTLIKNYRDRNSGISSEIHRGARPQMGRNVRGMCGSSHLTDETR